MNQLCLLAIQCLQWQFDACGAGLGM